MRDVIKASHDGLVMKCYTAGAKDMRDNNIYISPNQPEQPEQGRKTMQSSDEYYGLNGEKPKA
jgi:hypothetical protein